MMVPDETQTQKIVLNKGTVTVVTPGHIRATESASFRVSSVFSFWLKFGHKSKWRKWMKRSSKSTW